MKIELLKQILQETTGIQIVKVYFDRAHIVNVERDKGYPYVLWDLNSFRSRINWSSQNQISEGATMKAYVMGYFDKMAAEGQTYSREEVWDQLREAFREYLGLIGASSQIKLTNLNNMPNELFDAGVSVDAELAVSFDVNMTLYCNADDL